jgi:hypothetical protein
MKRHHLFSAIVLGLSLAVWSCSELKKDLPSPVSGAAAVHPDGWVQAASMEFHGAYLRAKNYETKECQPCHGGPLSGGTSQASCFRCHALYPHGAAWTQTDASDFHGRFLKAMAYNAQECQSCHGATYTGGTSSVSCYGCHASYPHRAEWNTGGDAGSHGLFLKAKSWNDIECRACHGATYTGGTSGLGCFTCHDAYPHSSRFSAGGHTAYLYANLYPLSGCRTCHGSSYTGGNAGESCMQAGCHVDGTGVPKSPEACNTCHGDFRSPAAALLSSAPPKGVLGETEATSRAVGAHAKHLLTGTVGKTVRCQECHLVPATLLQAGHINDKLPADVIMNDTLGRLVTGDGTLRPSPSWNGTSCGNTYCHGNWKLRKATSQYQWIYNSTDSVMVGAAYAPVWTGGSAQAACGTCHGLPPQGHSTAIMACYACHDDVNEAMQIVDPSRHINGKIDVLTQQIPMRIPAQSVPMR